MNVGLTPAQLDFDAAGTPVSTRYGDIYHAAEGGSGQARHVFLSGNNLPARWQERERFVILETGFGTGLNFLATWSAWRDDPMRCGRLHYLAVEMHPFQVQDLARLQANWPEFAGLSAELQALWPILTPGFHRLELERGQVILTLMFGDADKVLTRCAAQVDAYYLDGFDPKKNPEMWSPELMHKLARLAAPDATLATWCVAGTVRAALEHSGFIVEKQAGYGRKRHMLTGHLARPRAALHPTHIPADRRAILIGAGIAGCALAERLASRGWTVTLLERHQAPAMAASGNLAGIVRPMLSRDDNLVSRLNRACFLYAKRAWAVLDRQGHISRRDLGGALQIARDASQEAVMRDLITHAAYPENYAQFLDREAAGQQLGYPTRHGGWLFPGGGWANPPSLCRAWLAAGGEAIRMIAGREIARIERHGANWSVFDVHGQLVAEASHLILTSGASGTLVQGLPIYPIRGQVSHIPQGHLPDIRIAASCDGYLTPALDGMHCLGASYIHGGDEVLRVEEHTDNLARLATILPDAGEQLDHTQLVGKVGFRAATVDRLPMIGAVADPSVSLPPDIRLKNMPRREGLYALLGLGSRGLVWAALAAEILAGQLDGDPAPVETDLLEAIDPARFALRAHRRGHS